MNYRKINLGKTIPIKVMVRRVQLNKEVRGEAIGKYFNNRCLNL